MIFIDLETFSELDLKVCALDRYADHPSTRILMCAYALETGPVEIWEDNQPLPAVLKEAFDGRNAPVIPWNCSFERVILDKVGGIRGLTWADAMVRARYAGLPAALKDANRVPFFAGQSVTSKEARLISIFCKPQKDGSIRNRDTDPEEWALFLDYCQRDVADTRLIWQWCEKYFPMPERVTKVWMLDQEINRRGLPIDAEMCAAALKEAARLQVENYAHLKDFTGLDNPNSPAQLLKWVEARGYTYGGLGKELVKRFVEDPQEPEGEAKAALRLRLAGSKAAVKKFPKILETISPDNRLREQFKFYGAHTGRFSGRGAQVQNLKVPRTPAEKQSLRECLEALLTGRQVASLDALSFAGRPLIKAPKGYKVVLSDFKSVENRVVAWLADCEAMLAVYREGKDPYVDFATRLWDLPYEEISGELRQKAKPATLGCGFGLGGGREIRMAKCTACKHTALVSNETPEGSIFDCPECHARTFKAGVLQKTGLWRYAEALGVDITQEQAQAQVSIFREAFEEVCNLWYYLEEAFVNCCLTKLEQRVGPLIFRYQGPALRIILPSGRELVYANAWATRGRNAKGFKEIKMGFEGVKGSAWMRQTTYGGRLCENVVQAIAADLIWDALMRVSQDPRFEIVGHCHDEVITLALIAFIEARTVLDGYLSMVPDWAPGLIMAADGAEGERYSK